MSTENTTARELLAQYRAAKKKEAKKAKPMAYSKTEEAKKKAEAARQKRVKELAKNLTKNLPNADDINPNQQLYVLRDIVADAAFTSALENGVLIKVKSETTNLFVSKGKETLEVHPNELEEPAKILVDWSKLHRQLKDEKDKPYDKYSLRSGLWNHANSYRLEQERQKSSDEHLAELVKAMASVDLDTTKAGFNSTEALEELVAKTADTSKKQGKEFSKDRAGNLYLICADSRYGAVKLDTEKLKPHFQNIMDNSQLAGKFKSSNDVEKVITGFTNKQATQ
ncbi:hypothetical protein D2V08_00095 [Flagellimonas lutimaris]|uniref:Uncharacterized protein n=1 Tax=Flagellimonas lutimaris TaxID=475082 RepID=A0A3A1NB76_9FLAO|nr:hypothetical protein [Allomuricauda lutimaris]RIV38151.1 hypothetical protein D2V08_00095 [Allomuricauda lutimaris]